MSAVSNHREERCAEIAPRLVTTRSWIPVLGVELREEAASKVQRVWRGHVARQRFVQQLESELDQVEAEMHKCNSAATRIQAAVRGRAQRLARSSNRI